MEMTYYKNVLINVDEDSWKKYKTLPPASFVTGNLNFNFIEVLLHIGLATRHPEEIGISVNEFWAFLRYINCFQTDSSFKLNKKWADVDPHQKTILSDDFGMGFASYYLTKKMKIMAMTNTGYFLKYLPSLSVRSTSKRGPSKSPDFILLDQYLNLHILECKGTQNSIGALNQQMIKAASQKYNVSDTKGIISEKLRTGLFIPQFNSKDDAHFEVADPDFSLCFDSIDKNVIITKVLQGQLAKELHMVNLISLANSVASASDLKLIKVDTIIETISNTAEIAYDQSILNDSAKIKWSVYFDLSFLEEKKDLSNLHNLFLNLCEERVRYFKSYVKDNRLTFDGLFGLKMQATLTD